MRKMGMKRNLTHGKDGRLRELMHVEHLEQPVACMWWVLNLCLLVSLHYLLSVHFEQNTILWLSWATRKLAVNPFTLQGQDTLLWSQRCEETFYRVALVELITTYTHLCHLVPCQNLLSLCRCGHILSEAWFKVIVHRFIWRITASEHPGDFWKILIPRYYPQMNTDIESWKIVQKCHSCAYYLFSDTENAA